MAFKTIYRCDKCNSDQTVLPEGECPICVAKVEVEKKIEKMNSQEAYNDILAYIEDVFDTDEIYHYHFTRKLNRAWQSFTNF